MTGTKMHKEFDDQYAAVRDGGAGVLDLSSRGRILVSGEEAVMFLNGLVTNDMKTLAPNSWMPAAFPNVQGRLLASVRIIHRSDGFLIDTESASHATVLNLLNRFTLAGDFRVTDLTITTALLSVQGRNAAEVVRATLGDEAAATEREKVGGVRLENGSEATIIRATHTGEDGFDLFVDAEGSEQLSQSFEKNGAQRIGPEVLETLRIEAGIPRYGVDMDETTIVTETNLEDAVSFTKGCYIGQEIIIRIKHRGHVAKKLTGIVLKDQAVVENGAKLLSAEDKEIGRLTSSASSPRFGDRTVALGYVKYDYLAPHLGVKVSANRAVVTGEIAELPLVRGSWHVDQS
jgi:folate-binding protein YgfZ